MDFNFKVPDSFRKAAQTKPTKPDSNKTGSDAVPSANLFKSAFNRNSVFSKVNVPPRKPADGGPTVAREPVKPASKFSFTSGLGTSGGAPVKGALFPPRVPFPGQPPAQDRLSFGQNRLQRVEKPIANMVWQRKKPETPPPASLASEAQPLRRKPQIQRPIRRPQPPIPARPVVIAKTNEVNDEMMGILRELFNLEGKSCPTDFDRYQLLDERDKLMCKLRSASEKFNQTDGRKVSKKVTGECSSMCSEKEMYVRDVQKRISAFECDQNGIVKSKLIKEYARSAADQEKPLPHELRTVEMLHTSMSYLLLEILDRMPEQRDEWASWYDFLWSRTRAIRKEVTQLMLSDQNAIVLVERCTRLHILTAYMLCVLPSEQFDQKMNTENLGKCLQTLRHLYEDCGKNGHFFESEAEFRAYDIMLHLQDTNVLRQALDYRKEVRDSKPVRLAIQIASSLQNGNFVRFFRLLTREATFLQCCVVHRFFSEVRSRALSVMVASYKDFPHPLNLVVKTLGFDSEEQALNFLEPFNIRLHDDHQVLLSKHSFFIPAQLPSHILYDWIRNKTSDRLSQVVFGDGLIPMPRQSVISNSFDDGSYYTLDIVLTRLKRIYSKEVSKRQSLESVSEPPQPIVAPRPSDSAADLLAETAVNAVVDASLKSIVRTTFVEVCSEDLVEKTVDNVFVSIIKEVYQTSAKEAAENERRLRNELMKKKYLAIVNHLVDGVIDDCLHQQVEKRVNNEKKSSALKLNESATHFIANRLWDSKIVPYVDKELKHVIKKMVDQELSQLEIGLERFRINMHTLWIRQFWNTWRDRARSRAAYKKKRQQDWQNFKPVWNNSYFSPSRYLAASSSTNPPAALSRISPLERDPGTEPLEVVFFRRKRKLRLARWALEQWTHFVEIKKHNDRLVQLARQSAKKLQDNLKYFNDNDADRKSRKRISDMEMHQNYKNRRLSLNNFNLSQWVDDTVNNTTTLPPILNSTAFSNHSNEYFQPPNLSITTTEDNNLSTASFNQSLLTDRDVEYASRTIALGCSVMIPKKKEDPVEKARREEEEKLKESLHSEILNTSQVYSELETQAMELESSFSQHQKFLDDLIRTASARRLSFN